MKLGREGGSRVRNFCLCKSVTSSAKTITSSEGWANWEFLCVITAGKQSLRKGNIFTRACFLGGCAWFFQGGMCGFFQGGMHGFCGGRAWFFQGGHACFFSGGGMRGFFWGIQSMSGRYASYWNVFLYLSIELELKLSHWQIRGGARDAFLSVQFLSFSCSFCQKSCQIIGFCALLSGWSPKRDKGHYGELCDWPRGITWPVQPANQRRGHVIPLGQSQSSP